MPKEKTIAGIGDQPHHDNPAKPAQRPSKMPSAMDLSSTEAKKPARKRPTLVKAKNKNKVQITAEQAENINPAVKHLSMPNPNKATDLPAPSKLVTSLPPELFLKICQLLGPVGVACLGLTCKARYRQYWAQYPKARLFYSDGYDGPGLARLLKGWMAPLVWYWTPGERGKFYTEEMIDLYWGVVRENES